jgi:hypothetical protein
MANSIDWDEALNDEEDNMDDEDMSSFIQKVIAPATATLSAAAYGRATQVLKTSFMLSIPLYNVMLSGKMADNKTKETMKKMVEETFVAVTEPYAKLEAGLLTAELKKGRDARADTLKTLMDSAASLEEIEKSANDVLIQDYNKLHLALDTVKEVMLNGIDSGHIDAYAVISAFEEGSRQFELETTTAAALGTLMRSYGRYRELTGSYDEPTARKTASSSRELDEHKMMDKRTKQVDIPSAFETTTLPDDSRVKSHEITMMSVYTRPKKGVKAQEKDMVPYNVFPAHMEITATLDEDSLKSFLDDWGTNDQV